MPQHDFQPLQDISREGLAIPARYFPPASGRYLVTAGLSSLGTDFGNGDADSRLFQIDRYFDAYRHAKLAARSERFGKYVCAATPSDKAAKALHLLLIRQLHQEYSRLFRLEEQANRKQVLHCGLTGERLCFEHDGAWTGDGTSDVDPPYQSGLDALACQVQEDLALLEWNPAQGDRLTGLHLCFPNHWAAEAKIGRDFRAIHEPVAGFEKIAAQSERLLQALIRQGPFVRFAWGLATDSRLNHHPEPPPGVDPDNWQGRTFVAANPSLFVRVERQTITGLPRAGAALFTIRTSFLDTADLTRKELQQLQRAVESMSEASLAYKGLAAIKGAILSCIENRLSRAPAEPQIPVRPADNTDQGNGQGKPETGHVA